MHADGRLQSNGRPDTDGQIAASAPPWDAARAAAVVRGHAQEPGALLPVLHALQREFGYIDRDAAVPLVADVLNISRAEVVGTISFYHDFRDTPPGRHVLKMCRAEACQAMGAEALVAHAEGWLGARLGETTADRRVTLDAVYCLGNCALSPAIMLDGHLHGRVTPARLERLVGEAEAST
jgi:formate dehydrogenase subunit gamma